MLAALDVFFTVIKTFVSCFTRRHKLPRRSWRGEFIFRLAKSLLTRSIGKDFEWIRARQNLLTLLSPDVLKVTIQRTQINDVPCISFQSKKILNTDTIIIYIHGGGYAVGSAEGYKLTCAKLALQCNAKVISVDYRLVPDFPLPAAQDDCFAVTHAIASQHPQQKIILMGDSAGGTLCLSALQRLKACPSPEDDAIRKITACVLISPWVAPLSYENLSLENETHDMLDRPITQYWVDTFYHSETLKNEVDFSDITCLGLTENSWPKLYIQAAGAEVFLKQVKGLSEQLSELGVPHEFKIFPDQFHVFQTFSPLVPEAKTALSDIAEFVRLC